MGGGEKSRNKMKGMLPRVVIFCLLDTSSSPSSCMRNPLSKENPLSAIGQEPILPSRTIPWVGSCPSPVHSNLFLTELTEEWAHQIGS